MDKLERGILQEVADALVVAAKCECNTTPRGRRNLSTGWSLSIGICPNVQMVLLAGGTRTYMELIHLENVSMYVQTCMLQWPEYSGNIAYPVPSTRDGVSASQMYRAAKSSYTGLWGGAYGAARRRLCLWLVACIDHYLEEEE